MDERRNRIWELPGVWMERAVSFVESDRVSLSAAASIFSVSIALGGCLESFSRGDEFTLLGFLHVLMFWVSLSVAIGLLLHFVIGTPVIPILKVVLPCGVFAVFAPIIDLLVTGGAGGPTAFYVPQSPLDLIIGFLTFGGSLNSRGVLPGQRVEMALALLGCYFYARAKHNRRGLALLAAAAAYALVFLHASWAFVLTAILSIGGIQPEYTNALFAGSFALLVFVTGMVIAYRADKTAVGGFFRELNVLRLIHYIAMFGWGLVRPEPGYPLLWDQRTVLFILLVTAGVFLAMLFLIRLEQVSRGAAVPDRWLLILIGLPLFYACLAGFEYGVLMMVFLGIFYLYHGPEVALKRIRLGSRLVLSVNSLLLILAGYLIRGQGPGQFYPWIAIVIMTGAAAFGLVELVWAKRRPHSHRGIALVAGHLTSAAAMGVYQIIY